MNGGGHILLIVLFFAASALFSGMETGGYLLNRIRLRFRARRNDRAARRLQSALSDAHIFIFTVLIGNNIAVYLVSSSVTQLYLAHGLEQPGAPLLGFIPWSAESAATLTLMLPLFLFAEMIPKVVFHRYPDALMYRCSVWLRFSQFIFYPLTRLIKAGFNLLTGGKGRSEALSRFSLSLQGFRDYFSDVPRRTLLTDHQHLMIENLVAMHRVAALQVMRPIPSDRSLSENAIVADVIERMRQADCQKLCLFRGSIRHTTGFVNLLDLLGSEINPSDSVKLYMRKPGRISADLSLNKAFRRLHETEEDTVLVTDRRSRTVGLLTLRDIARYIVSMS